MVWTEEPLPKVVLDKLSKGYMSPVLVVETDKNKLTWPEKSGIYTIDQMYEFCQNVHAKIINNIPEQAMGAGVENERPVGALSCRSYVDQLFTYYATYLPNGTKATMKWNRSGNEQFNLYGGKKAKLSTETLLGDNGGFSFDITYNDNVSEAAKLLVRELAFTYSANGPDMAFDIQRVLIHDLVTMIDAKLASVGGEQPKGFIGIMTLWTVVSVVRDIWALTHPTLDLYLGSVVSATTYQDGDTIYVDFKDMPQVRIVMLFSFKLNLKQIKITHKRIDAIFTGSRIIKHYGFDVK